LLFNKLFLENRMIATLAARSLQGQTKVLIAGLFVAAALLTMPAPAHAAQLTDAQIQAIENLLTSFNADQSAVSEVDAVLRGSATSQTQHQPQPSTAVTTASGASACGTFMRTLHQGDQGSDVQDLQEKLHEKGLLNASSTGFFGPMTEEALGRWQAMQGIVTSGDPGTTGFGKFGPRTREQFMRTCKEGLPQPKERDNKGDHATSTMPRPPRGGSERSSIDAGQFLSDYADAFNQNMASVATATVEVPLQILTGALSDLLFAAGLY
jgi:peptidoglycan hydrolase-like protein with peptidoglycan-binding domain